MIPQSETMTVLYSFDVLAEAVYSTEDWTTQAALKDSTPPLPGTRKSFILETLWTDPGCRGHGSASQLMRGLTELADREGSILALRAASISDHALDDQQLLAFYDKFGFRIVDPANNWMERLPRGL